MAAGTFQQGKTPFDHQHYYLYHLEKSVNINFDAAYFRSAHGNHRLFMEQANEHPALKQKAHIFYYDIDMQTTPQKKTLQIADIFLYAALKNRDSY